VEFYLGFHKIAVNEMCLSWNWFPKNPKKEILLISSRRSHELHSIKETQFHFLYSNL
jgi:hypothetical protein